LTSPLSVSASSLSIEHRFEQPGDGGKLIRQQPVDQFHARVDGFR